MKIKLIIIFMALLPLSVFWLNADDNDRKEIPLTQTYNGEYGKDNRSINLIECCYSGMMNFIQTSVYTNLGEITVEAINTTTGESVWDSFDSKITTQHILPISSTSGHYIVTYITETGDVYEGSFIIQ